VFESTEAFRGHLNELETILRKVLEPDFKIRKDLQAVEVERLSAELSNLATTISVKRTLYKNKRR